jgi:hypothetical protein
VSATGGLSTLMAGSFSSAHCSCNPTAVRALARDRTSLCRKRENIMRRQLVALLASGAFVATNGAAMAHHSFAMFDQVNLVELEGTVQEFKYVSPHSFIFLQVKNTDGETTVWNLEGVAPSALARTGWSGTTLKPGDEIKLTIQPLRSGAPGGQWSADKIKFKDGQPIVVSH